MKEFNLTEYLKDPSKRVVTRDGREVRIICTDFKCQMNKPIIALVKEDKDEEKQKENIECFFENGKYLFFDVDSPLDLFFAPVKKEGWINLFKDEELTFINGDVYENEKDAKEAAQGEPDFIATVKIEWEE